MLFTSYGWHLFTLYDIILIVFIYVTFISFYCKPHEAQMFQCRGQSLL